MACVRKEARAISIDARVANFNTNRRRGEPGSSSPVFKTRWYTISKLFRATTKIILVKEKEKRNFKAGN